MIASRRWFVARGRAVLGFSLGLGLVIVLGSCQADTLYQAGTPNVQPPTIVITSPATGAAVQAGHTVPVRMVATDAAGVSQIVLTVSGALQQTIVKSYSPPRDSVVLDTVVVVPAGTSGNVQLRARAVNAGGASAEYGPVALAVSSTDVIAPTVTMTFGSMPRMELTDSFTVQVHGTDNPGGSGVAKLGYTAIVTNPRLGQTQAFTDSVVLARPVADTTVRFALAPPLVDALDLPDSLRVEMHAFAVDSAGLCTGAVDASGTPTVGCDVATIGGRQVRVAARVGAKADVLVVAGRTSAVPGGGSIPDLLVDNARARVYVSNFSRNLVQVLGAATGAWQSDVQVGSEPWGLAWNANHDSVFVANSGGTNLSVLSVSGTPKEDVARRFYTPDAPLFQISSSTGGGAVRLSGTFIELSDRPQYIAEDAAGRLLYSTQPTPSASDGTIRVVTRQPGWPKSESRLLVRSQDIVYAQNSTAIAHVDSIQLYTNTGGDDAIQIWDHQPGFPGTIIASGIQSLPNAIAYMEAHGSDILWGQGTWSLKDVAFADTTFVAASADRKWLAFGAGATAPAGRIVLWSSDAAAISSNVPVTDLVANASERVQGLDLNSDGTLGAARSDVAAYFFTRDLRLQGSFADGLGTGAGGIAIDPGHPSFYEGVLSNQNTLAFVGTGNHTIRIIDTIHFNTRGEIAIRDNIVGRLEAAPRLPGDPADVVLKLYGVTSSDGILVLDVHSGDITSF